MGTPVKSRLLLLIEESGLNENDFLKRCHISHGTLSKIKKGEFSDKTVALVAKGLNANIEWIKEGVGPKYKSPVEEVNPWKDALVIQISQERDTWKAEYNRVWSTLSDVINRGGFGGKLAAFNGTDRRERSLNALQA
jgi:hypothetical protein